MSCKYLQRECPKCNSEIPLQKTEKSHTALFLYGKENLLRSTAISEEKLEFSMFQKSIF